MMPDIMMLVSRAEDLALLPMIPSAEGGDLMVAADVVDTDKPVAVFADRIEAEFAADMWRSGATFDWLPVSTRYRDGRLVLVESYRGYGNWRVSVDGAPVAIYPERDEAERRAAALAVSDDRPDSDGWSRWFPPVLLNGDAGPAISGRCHLSLRALASCGRAIEFELKYDVVTLAGVARSDRAGDFALGNVRLRTGWPALPDRTRYRLRFRPRPVDAAAPAGVEAERVSA